MGLGPRAAGASGAGRPGAEPLVFLLCRRKESPMRVLALLAVLVLLLPAEAFADKPGPYSTYQVISPTGNLFS